MKTDKKALGRGLKAILESPDTDITSHDISGKFVAGAVAEISIDNIEPNPFQPRKKFDISKIESLAETIKEQGIIQPITVRKVGFDKYQIISGERRFRAVQILEFSKVPAYIKIASDVQMLEMAIVENVQRDDLNAIEISNSYKRLIDECNITHEDLSKKVGKSRTTITNFLRLLKLPDMIQQGIISGTVSMAHARTLINIEDENEQMKIYASIIKGKLSVRETEAMSREANTSSSTKRKSNPKIKIPNELNLIKEKLAKKLNTNIKIQLKNKGKGNIVINFNSEDDFNRIANILDKKSE